MNQAKWVLAGIVSLASAPCAWAIQGDGLVANVDRLSWSGWQGRISLGSSLPAWHAGLSGAEPLGSRVDSVTLVGDYYFSRSLIGHGSRGGFRTTGGLIYGPRSQLTSWRPLGADQRAAFGIGRHVFGAADGSGTEVIPDFATLPYLGVGYTGLSLRGRWRFNADLGMLALTPGSSVKLGKSQGANTSLDDVVREMRLAPVLQLGVSYSF